MSVVGSPVDRVDGYAKVTGSARYSAEFTLPRLAHAVMVQSTVASGRIARLDTAAATQAPGALAVLTHLNAPQLPAGGKAAVNPPAGRVMSLLQDDVVHYNGQPIAVVVADTLEHAVAAASLLKISYTAQVARLDFNEAKRSAYKPEKAGKYPADSARGSFDTGLQAADAKVDAVYTTPLENHNPMEPHATIAAWEGDRLTLYDATQYVVGVKRTVAKTLGIPAENVHVISPFVGGGFGCKGSVWSHVVLTAMAAQQVGRPVKLVLARPQMFGPVGGRARTEQHIVLGATRDGQLTALRHDCISNTSFIEDFVEPAAAVSRMLYACPNESTTHRLVKLNLGTPTFQRAPGEASGSFAIESAMDELAYALSIDPVELRLRNYAEKDPESGKPWSSKSLRECYRVGAERFGWARRSAKPQSWREGREWAGWGMATATYPANRSEASAVARILPNGTALIRAATQELGTGTYTVMSQVAAEALGLPLEKVRFELGDTEFPETPISGGSMTANSVAPAVQAAARAARDKLIDTAIADRACALFGARQDDVAAENGWLYLRSNTAKRELYGTVIARHGDAIEARGNAKPGPEREQYSMHSFGAVFTEVRVDPEIGRIRVPRIVGTYGVGTLLNTKTARSQLIGGIVWGVSLALFEETHFDLRNGHPINGNLAEYHVPVNADIGSIDVFFVDEHDPYVNSLGTKGIGEIGITGVAAALANAVYHATGRRVRDVPITLDKLL